MASFQGLISIAEQSIYDAKLRIGSFKIEGNRRLRYS